MKKVKFILILVALALVLTSGSFVLAKEKNEKEKNKHGDVKELLKELLPVNLTATSTPAEIATTTATSTTPVATTTPPTATTTPPVATTTPPIISTTTPTTATTTATTTPKKVATSTPIIASINDKVNDILGDGFFASNYYGSSAFGAGTTRALKFVGIAAVIAGLGFIVSGRFVPKRIIHN